MAWKTPTEDLAVTLERRRFGTWVEPARCELRLWKKCGSQLRSRPA
jgi:hypothetical protein